MYKGIYNVRTGFVGKQDGELTAKMCGSPQHERDCGNVKCGLVIIVYALSANQIDFKTKLTHSKTDIHS